MRLIYLILICFAAPVAALVAWLRGWRDPSRAERLTDRIGRPCLAGGSLTIWVHAASMGEVQAGAVLVRELMARYPKHRLVMTTMTTTGAGRVEALFAGRVTHCYLPYDLPFAVRGFMARVQPSVALILETELWPTLLRECARRRVPVIVASARISPHTANRYRRLRSLFRDSLTDNVCVAAQTANDAARFKSLGASNVIVSGNIKFDIDIPVQARAAGEALRAQIGNRFVWVAGSTHAGEELAALDAHRGLLAKYGDALLILVPRHPQRFEEVRALLGKYGLRFAARSSQIAPRPSDAVLFGDSMGELLALYAAGDAAFVGGSLVPVGGHNLLEPAALGLPVLFGPYMFAAQEIADLLLNAGAAQLVNANQLADAVLALAADASQRTTMGEHGAAVVLENRGAVERVLALVGARLPAAQ